VPILALVEESDYKVHGLVKESESIPWNRNLPSLSGYGTREDYIGSGGVGKFNGHLSPCLCWPDTDNNLLFFLPLPYNN